MVAGGPLVSSHDVRARFSPLIQSTTCCGLHLLTGSMSPVINAAPTLIPNYRITTANRTWLTEERPTQGGRPTVRRAHRLTELAEKVYTLHGNMWGSSPRPLSPSSNTIGACWCCVQVPWKRWDLNTMRTNLLHSFGYEHDVLLGRLF